MNKLQLAVLKTLELQPSLTIALEVLAVFFVSKI